MSAPQTPARTAERDTRAIVLAAPPLRSTSVCQVVRGDTYIHTSESSYHAGLRTPKLISTAIKRHDPADIMHRLCDYPYHPAYWEVRLYRHDSAGREWSTTVPMLVDCYGDLVEVQP